ncbi:UDP-glucose dehydrogenase family protein [Bradyrhizobium canariense]|uniref:UDP-glucose dehydrogenase family protein n=1 Tax=Bradyrhizobium canariense TaxID=255045 RepID=UPI0013747424|nr:UDP-glucose/GDP-mannose dehydrogenase family protein [Bradyrhizobium canariense]
MKLSVIGTGYVGLVSGVCFASKGHDVVCVDVSEEKVSLINRKIPPIHEEGLPELLRTVIDERKFRATSNLNEALDFCEAVIVAVGTPTTDGKLDLTYLVQAIRQIGAYLKSTNKFLSVIIKSTVLPTTTDTVVREAITEASGRKVSQFGLGMNPEFLREGKAISDFNFPDRIVLGFDDSQTREVLSKIYEPWNVDKVYVNTRTAEMIKYANNCLLALQVSAANELANLAAKLGGIDFMDVFRGVTLDKRWNPIGSDGSRTDPEILTYLVPGPGFGGSCFPKDVQAIRTQGQNNGLPMEILEGVLSVNAKQPEQVTKILGAHFGNLESKNILLLGLAFKPETDDVRESASIRISEELLAQKTNLVAHDPIATENFIKFSGVQTSAIRFTKNWRAEIANADAIVVATRWAEYKALPGLKVAGKVVFDTRRLLSPKDFPSSTYFSIGRRV